MVNMRKDGLQASHGQHALRALLPVSGRGIRCWLPALAALLLSAAVAAAEIPIIDAHSQVDFSEDMERIIRLMDKAGVATTILAARRKVKPEHVLALRAAIRAGSCPPCAARASITWPVPRSSIVSSMVR